MTKIIWNKPFAWANFESNSKSEQLPSESKLSQVTRDLDRDNSKSKRSMNRGLKPFENDPREIRITAIASYFESNSKSQQSPSSTIRIEAITSWSRLFDLGTIHQGNRIKLWNRIRINQNQENQNQAYTWRSRSMVMAKEFEFQCWIRIRISLNYKNKETLFILFFSMLDFFLICYILNFLKWV